MLRDIENIDGKFERELPKYFAEYHLEFKNFGDIKELIDFWGLLYQGEKRFDTRQLLGYSRRRKIDDLKKVERILIRQSRMEMRSDVYFQLSNRNVKDMDENVQWVAELLYRAKLCEVAI
ncbi:TPA: hypothetical protein U5Y67_000086 [Streptococcus agalactiae]|nr:hypothetical protein [Streptococcus agalactiae]HEN4303143.1 hypothetical protein [Streptococcus agalactiae]